MRESYDITSKYREKDDTDDNHLCHWAKDRIKLKMFVTSRLCMFPSNDHHFHCFSQLSQNKKLCFYFNFDFIWHFIWRNIYENGNFFQSNQIQKKNSDNSMFGSLISIKKRLHCSTDWRFLIISLMPICIWNVCVCMIYLLNRALWMLQLIFCHYLLFKMGKHYYQLHRMQFILEPCMCLCLSAIVQFYKLVIFESTVKSTTKHT